MICGSAITKTGKIISIEIGRSRTKRRQIAGQATEDANGLAKGQYIPHVIEPSAGVDRLILALIANAYSRRPDDRTTKAKRRRAW